MAVFLQCPVAQRQKGATVKPLKVGISSVRRNGPLAQWLNSPYSLRHEPKAPGLSSTIEQGALDPFQGSANAIQDGLPER
jgi:hypothetical protein